MKLADALELQRRILERGLHRVGSKEPELLGRSGDFHLETAADRPDTTLAIGILGDGERFGLAVRSWRDGEDVREAVSAIEQENPVDFRVVGRITALSKPWHQSKISPLWPGCSAAHHRVSLGTAGCFVALRTDAARWPHMLSNNHVLAREREDHEPRHDDRIFQPAKGDDDDPADDTAAQLTDWVPLQAEGNLVDAAIARLAEGIIWQPDVLDGLGSLRGVRPATEALTHLELVHKIGRTTGRTTGRVKAQHLEPLSVGFEIRDRSFRDVFEIESDGSEPFCDHGDSGSLVVDDQLRAVGLLFAKADAAGTAYANPIHHVLDALQIDLLLEVTT